MCQEENFLLPVCKNVLHHVDKKASVKDKLFSIMSDKQHFPVCTAVIRLSTLGLKPS